MSEYLPSATIQSMDAMVRAYLECAEWCGIDDDERELFEGADEQAWTIAAEVKAEADCAAFRTKAGNLMEYVSAEQAGHDFWLSRNGHGAGFFDRGWGALGDALQDIAQGFGEQYVIVLPATEWCGVELEVY